MVARERKRRVLSGGFVVEGKRRKRKPAKLRDDVEPWERQNHESEPAWKAFQVFLQLEKPRRTYRVIDESGSSRESINRWRTRNNWILRAQKYDEHLDEKTDALKDKARAEMLTRQLRLSKLLQATGGKVVSDLLVRLERGEKVEIDVGQARQLIEAGVKIERAALGEPENISEVRGQTQGQAQAVIVLPSNGRELQTLQELEDVIEAEVVDDDENDEEENSDA